MARGQAHTLEGIVAALLLLSSIIFALQATAVTPLSASTSNQHIENQHQALAEGMLTTTAENGTLKDALLYYGNENGEYRFHCAADEDTEYYPGETENPTCSYDLTAAGIDHVPPNQFGLQIEETFGTGIAANVNIRYLEGDSTTSKKMLFQGDPSDNAIRSSTVVTLHDDDRLLASDGSTGSQLVNEPNFYAPDAFPDSEVYNVVRVEVVVWRI